ncbi:MAG: permease-like cell division protein FtsX [Salinisphaeraceae bacterium]
MTRDKRETQLAPTRLAQQHARDLIDSLGRLYRTPVASLLTACVIGITLALPGGLRLLLTQLDALSYQWQDTVQASLFLNAEVDAERGRALATSLAERDDIASTRFISREEALAEFRQLSGFGEAIDAMADNPLPAVITLQPSPDLDADGVSGLIDALGERPEVDQARLDQAWLKRLYAVLDVARRAVGLIAVLLAFAVVFIVGNTIRLDIENRREEIAIMKLLGAPDGFVRRPFLYSGFWYGLGGGLLAWLLLSICLLALSGPVERLVSLYGNDGGMAWLSWRESGFLILSGVLLGWLGSAWTVGRHLRAIEPR